MNKKLWRVLMIFAGMMIAISLFSGCGNSSTEKSKEPPARQEVQTDDKAKVTEHSEEAKNAQAAAAKAVKEKLKEIHRDNAASDVVVVTNDKPIQLSLALDYKDDDEAAAVDTLKQLVPTAKKYHVDTMVLKNFFGEYTYESISQNITRLKDGKKTVIEDLK